ncbi:scarecrow-like protein 9 [Carex rostrata]
MLTILGHIQSMLNSPGITPLWVSELITFKGCCHVNFCCAYKPIYQNSSFCYRIMFKGYFGDMAFFISCDNFQEFKGFFYLPQPGFHPAERINETGRRLEDYARSFGVPFEYQGIASQWEAICIDDLSINDDEVLIVNNIYNLGSARDEPLSGKFTPRNKLLDLIQETKPKLFVQGIFNLSFSPFFITRFRQVLLQYSRYFDMHDMFFPGDYKHMQLVEREIYGPSIINLIACEGSDLVRPENYKHWHMQNLQSGFQPFPVDPRVVKECREMFRTGYNEAYFVEEDCNWFFWGWKGNIIRAISLWKPKAG